MGLFDKFKKKKTDNDTDAVKQDLNNRNEHDGWVFLVHLLFREKPEMPTKEYMSEVMQNHLGNETECFSHNYELAGFAAKKYKTVFKEGPMPPQLMITKAFSTDEMKIDQIMRSQMWDCPESESILRECKYHIVANDMMAAGLDSAERAEMLTNYIEALAEMFPNCEAMLFRPSGKMYKREEIVSCNVPFKQRFIYYAVNVRFFNIQDTNDMVIDSLGMSVLGLPDVQYHFHGLDPNEVVNHAYNVLLYIFENDCPIKNGETVDGIKGGEMSREVHWKCQFEDALIQPARTVMDICPNEFAAGGRNG